MRSSDGREYVRNSSHLKAYKRAHEIILPSFVGKEEEGNNVHGKASDDIQGKTSDDNSSIQDYASHKQTLRRSNKSRVEPESYGQEHCKLHCCLSRSEGE